MIDYINKLTRRRTSSGTKRNRAAAAAKAAAKKLKAAKAALVKAAKAKTAKARKLAFKRVMQALGIGALAGTSYLTYSNQQHLQDLVSGSTGKKK